MMDFNKYAAKGNQILDEVAVELGFVDDRERAGRILRAVLHTLRERLTIQESFQLIAQLPFVIKALYVEGWKYQEKPFRIKHIGEFVKNVIHEDFPVGHHDISTAKDGENAIMAVLKVIKRHVSEGEIRDILATIPADLHPLWGEVKKEPSS
ncbi:hypothetical protein C900_00046 [Fulvivirga imtechensis AK7]|uniref:DUF2267 domain-containing protein n=1 Tax=Fulvivirga imtechensis AK7 TaxID=1237149 RepID=L8K341_9BACT|nr:DUF2267 domain-containing protein [Fulvivirga imtechensis]ELR73882.1 hypothetical protein C900_00046 [Fulvivirga imtechensis AK7]